MVQAGIAATKCLLNGILRSSFCIFIIERLIININRVTGGQGAAEQAQKMHFGGDTIGMQHYVALVFSYSLAGQMFRGAVPSSVVLSLFNLSSRRDRLPARSGLLQCLLMKQDELEGNNKIKDMHGRL